MKAKWIERPSVSGGHWYELPGHAHVGRDAGGSWVWAAFYLESPGMTEGGGSSPEECMRAAEAAIRAHARRLLELVGEEP